MQAVSKIIIRPSSDLRNKYTEISEHCKQSNAPVFITKNGVGDLVVMSIENYERIMAITELHVELSKGLQDIEEGRTRSATDVFQKLWGGTV